MIKKLCVAMLLVASSGLFAARDKIVIESKMLAFVDGTPFIDINEIIYFGHNVKVIMSGGTGRDIKKLVDRYAIEFPVAIERQDKVCYGLLYFDGQYRSLKQLVEIEKDFESIYTDCTDCEKIDLRKQMHDALISAQDMFSKISLPYLDEIQGAKGYMVKIIEKWSDQRNRPDSELLAWSKLDGDEEESLRKAMTSFAVLDVFFEDLLCFLSDLVQSCPRSWSSYVKMIKELRAHKK